MQRLAGFFICCISFDLFLGSMPTPKAWWSGNGYEYTCNHA